MKLVQDIFNMSIKHDKSYNVTIGINTSKRPKECNIFIPVALPITIDEIDVCLFHFLKAVFGVMLSSIILSRLGTPRRRTKVIIYLSGDFRGDIKDECELILKKFMVSRTILSGNTLKDVKVEIQADNFKNNKYDIPFYDDKIIIPFSGGIDSTSIFNYYLKCNFKLFPVFVEYESDKSLSDVYLDRIAANKILNLLYQTKDGLMIKVHFDEIKEHIPWNTRMYRLPYSVDPQIQDRDDWNFYGRNALLAAAVLFLCVSKRAKYLCFGHTKEGLFSIFDINGNIFYDRCCASIYFIQLFNKILTMIFQFNPPQIVAPLMDMNKGNILKYLLRDPYLLSPTRSCISPEKIEDGICFSCFDKMTGILANVDHKNLKIKKIESAFEIFEDKDRIARFQWVPENENSGLWGIQLERFQREVPDISINLSNSIYSPYPIIAACFNMEKNRDLHKYIPKEYFKLVRSKKINIELLNQISDCYTKSMTPLYPSDFLKIYNRKIDKNKLDN